MGEGGSGRANGASDPRAARPLPLADDASGPFWEACTRHELVVQTCGECGAVRFPPRPMCPRCRSLRCQWRPLSGRGSVYSWVICYGPVLPAFRERVPFPVVLVELAEDPALRMLGNLVELRAGALGDVAPEVLRVGLPVEVCFEDVAPDVVLPQWRLAGTP